MTLLRDAMTDPSSHVSSPATNVFRFRFRVRYGECDAQGVVFNARFADYVDIAVNEYIRTLFGDYRRLLEQDRDIQVVSLTVNWKSPARFDDVLEARVMPGRLGTTSFTLHLLFVRYQEEAPIAEADITYVLIQPSLMTKVVIDGTIREKLGGGAAGTLISHAGEAG